MRAIMAAGIGAMVEAARIIEKEQRKVRRLMADREATGHSAGRLTMDRGQSVSQGEERTGFDCFFLCGNCKLLTDEGEGRCPACGAEEWIDLADHATANELRMVEEQARQRVPPWVKLVALFTTMVPALLVSALLANWSAISKGLSFGLGLAVVVVALGAMFAIQKPLAAFVRRWESDPPSRWRMPLPQPAETEPRTEAGPPVLPDNTEPLTAPFSGRSCFAWEVAVLFDVPGDAMPPEWLLHEVRAASFTINGEAVAGDQVRPKAALEPLTHEQLKTAEGKPNLKRFLRKRGLFEYEGEFEVFEAIVAADVPVDVTWSGESAPVQVAAR